MVLKVGDIVKLKSGSSLMTIEYVGKYISSNKIKAKCIWFDNANKYDDIFVLESLEIVNK